MLDFPCFQGPDQEQQKVEPHHTVVLGDGDCVKFENKVRDLPNLTLTLFLFSFICHWT